MNFDTLFAYKLLNNPLYDWLIATTVLLGTLLVLLALRRVIRKSHTRMLETPEVELMELPLGILSQTTVLFFLAVGAYFALTTLTFSKNTRHIADSIITIAVFF